MSSLLQRLKDRKLFQWTLAYLAGAWLVLEGIDFLSELLFEDPYVRRFFYTNYDIDSDGERFVMIKSGEESAQLIVVLNWFEELRRRNLAMPD